MLANTKQATMAQVLMFRSLNRFEAEKYGDHCLNTTISDLRKDGYKIFSQWEKAPNSFGSLTRCKRYKVIGLPKTISIEP